MEDQVRTRPVMWETLAIMALCLADTYSTLLVVLTGLAVEANPILSAALAHSPLAFVVVKLCWSIPGVIALELVRWIRPGFALWAARFGVAGYILVYVVGSIVIHL